MISLEGNLPHFSSFCQGSLNNNKISLLSNPPLPHDLDTRQASAAEGIKAHTVRRLVKPVRNPHLPPIFPSDNTLPQAFPGKSAGSRPAMNCASISPPPPSRNRPKALFIAVTGGMTSNEHGPVAIARRLKTEFTLSSVGSCRQANLPNRH